MLGIEWFIARHNYNRDGQQPRADNQVNSGTGGYELGLHILVDP